MKDPDGAEGLLQMERRTSFWPRRFSVGPTGRGGQGSGGASPGRPADAVSAFTHSDAALAPGDLHASVSTGPWNRFGTAELNCVWQRSEWQMGMRVSVPWRGECK